MADPSDLNRPYNSSVQVTSAWLNAVSDRLLNPTKTDWRQWSDADLDTSPGSLSDRFAKYADQLRVTANVGRVVSISPGYVGLSDGSILEIGTVATSTPASLTIPDNTTLKVYVAPSGVAYGPTLPVGSLYLADVTTAGGYVMNIADRRSLVSLMASTNGALEDRLDTLAAALGSVETSVDFSTANDGDIIRVGSDGGLVASDPFTAIGINASFLDGIDANLNPNGASGKSVILGTDNSLIFGDAPANSLGEYTLNVPVWNTHETLVRSPSGDIRAAGGLRLEYGSGPTNFVYGDRRYALDVAGTTHSAVFPRPTRRGEFIEITNLGTTSALTLDFRTNAVGTSVGNGLLGTGASEVFIATGTNNTSDWWTFAQPSTIGSAATGAGGGSSGGSTANYTADWSTVGSAWNATSLTVTGGGARTLVGAETLYPGILADGATHTLDADELLYATGNARIIRYPLGLSSVITSIPSGASGAWFLSDGRLVYYAGTSLHFFNFATNTSTAIPMNGRTTPVYFVAQSDNFLYTFESTTISQTTVYKLDLATLTWTTLSSIPITGAATAFWGADDKIWVPSLQAQDTSPLYKFTPSNESFSGVVNVPLPGGTDERLWKFLGLSRSGRAIFSGYGAGFISVSVSGDSAVYLSAPASVASSITSDRFKPLPDGRMISVLGTNQLCFLSSDGLSATVESLTGISGRTVLTPDGKPYFSNGKILEMGWSTSLPLSVILSKFFNYR